MSVRRGVGVDFGIGSDVMSEVKFACRLLTICIMVAGWMTDQILNRPERNEPVMHPDRARSYLEQIRRKLDELEKDVTRC